MRRERKQQRRVDRRRSIASYISTIETRRVEQTVQRRVTGRKGVWGGVFSTRTTSSAIKYKKTWQQQKPAEALAVFPFSSSSGSAFSRTPKKKKNTRANHLLVTRVHTSTSCGSSPDGPTTAAAPLAPNNATSAAPPTPAFATATGSKSSPEAPPPSLDEASSGTETALVGSAGGASSTPTARSSEAAPSTPASPQRGAPADSTGHESVRAQEARASKGKYG